MPHRPFQRGATLRAAHQALQQHLEMLSRPVRPAGRQLLRSGLLVHRLAAGRAVPGASRTLCDVPASSDESEQLSAEALRSGALPALDRSHRTLRNELASLTADAEELSSELHSMLVRMNQLIKKANQHASSVRPLSKSKYNRSASSGARRRRALSRRRAAKRTRGLDACVSSPGPTYRARAQHTHKHTHRLTVTHTRARSLS